MSWTIGHIGVNGDFTGANGTTAAVTVTAIGSGHSVAIFGQYGGATQSVTVTDNASGNTYTLKDNIEDTTNGQTFCSFECLSVSNAPTTFTLNIPTTTSFRSIAVIEFSWSLGGTPTFNTHTATATTSAATSLPTGSVSCLVGDLAVAGATADGGAFTITAQSPFAQQNNNSTFSYGDGTDTTSGTTISTSFTTSTSSTGIAAIMTFSAPASAAVFIPRRPPLQRFVIPILRRR